MFTLQNRQLDALLQDTPSTSLLSITSLREMLGNCQQPLEHRAPITINLNPNDSRPAISANVDAEVNPFYSAFTSANYTGYVEPDPDFPDLVVNRGWAGMFIGPVNIRANIFPFAPNRIALVVHNGVWADDYYGNRYLDQNGDPYYAYAVQPAVADADSVQSTGRDLVDFKFTDGWASSSVTGSTLTATLPKRAYSKHDVKAGDKLAIAKGVDGTYVVVSDYSRDMPKWYYNSTLIEREPDMNLIGGTGVTVTGVDAPLDERVEYTISLSATSYPVDYQHNGSLVGTRKKLNFVDTTGNVFTVTDNSGSDRVDVSVTAGKTVLWGKTQHQWEKNSGDPRVSIKAVPGYPGSTTETGSAFYIKLPNPNPSAYDPNVIKGKYVPYMEDDSGNFVCVGDYLDAKIKTTRGYLGDPDDLIILDGSVNISGWGWMDGTDNATGNGGTAINSKDYFIANKEADTNAVSGGSDLIAAGTHTHSVTVNSNTTGITTDDHVDHVHEVGCANTSKDVPNGGSNYYGLISMTDQHTPSGVFYTGIQKATNDHSSAHGSLTLSHTVNDSGHGHSGSSGSSHSDPAKFRIYIVERMDNSYEILSI